MKIIAGRWRGRKLDTPTDDKIRPTKAKMRESLFSMLTSRLGRLDDVKVIDLFAGTGALGLEALSRGASHAVFVEKNPQARKVLSSNINKLKANADILNEDATRLGPAPHSVHLAFLDPPYEQNLAVPVLLCLDQGKWLRPNAWVSLETSSRENLSLPEYYHIDNMCTQGKSCFYLLRYGK